MASLLCGAGFLRRLASRLHKECKKSASSAASSASTPFSPAARAAVSSAGPAVAGVSSSAVSDPRPRAAVSAAPGHAFSPSAVLRAAAAAARAASIIPRKVLPAIPFCSNEEYALAEFLGMKAPPTSFWTLQQINPWRISALSRDGNPPVFCSSLPPIEEAEEPLPESAGFTNAFSLSACSLHLCFEDRGSDIMPPVDPLYAMLMAKVHTNVEAASSSSSFSEYCSYDSLELCDRDDKHSVPPCWC